MHLAELRERIDDFSSELMWRWWQEQPKFTGATNEFRLLRIVYTTALRSPYPHARLLHVDRSKVEECPTGYLRQLEKAGLCARTIFPKAPNEHKRLVAQEI